MNSIRNGCFSEIIGGGAPWRQTSSLSSTPVCYRMPPQTAEVQRPRRIGFPTCSAPKCEIGLPAKKSRSSVHSGSKVKKHQPVRQPSVKFPERDTSLSPGLVRSTYPGWVCSKTVDHCDRSINAHHSGRKGTLTGYRPWLWGGHPG